MKIVSLANTSATSLATCWNDVYPKIYAITPQIVQYNLLDHPLTLTDHSLAIVANGSDTVQAFICIKKGASGILHSGKAQNHHHLAAIAFRDEETMSRLWQFWIQNKPSSLTSLVLGQDYGHLLPGVPKDAETLRRWMEAHNWKEKGEKESDLERDLREYKLPEKFMETIESTGASFRFATAADEAELDAFFLRAFPGRWHYDTVTVKGKESNEWSDIYLLIIDQKIEGFACVQTSETTSRPVAGCVWHTSLGERWGGLGPIGISSNIRGSGMGGALLDWSLSQLAQRGVRRCIIDWTKLVGFYKKYGFEVTREYQPMQISLE